MTTYHILSTNVMCVVSQIWRDICLLLIFVGRSIWYYQYLGCDNVIYTGIYTQFIKIYVRNEDSRWSRLRKPLFCKKN